MTAVLERTEPVAPPPVPRHRSRFGVTVVAVVVLVAVSAFANEAIHLRTQIGTQRRALAASRAQEATTTRAIEAVHRQTRAAGSARAVAATRDREQRKERADAAAVLTSIDAELSSANRSLTNTIAVQQQVAQYTKQRDGCIAGVEAATIALQENQPKLAVGALNATAAACSAALAAATGARFPYDFPDPSVLAVGSDFYAYSTNSGAGNIQVLASTDLVHWTIVGDGLAGLPGWAAPGATWAPTVTALGSGYVAYYTVRDIGSGVQCVSVATSARPAGPFVDSSTHPLVCQPAGSIDPSPFVDATGTPWLLWKSEATATAPTTIWSQQLSPDGLTFLPGSTPTPLLTPGQSWEHGIVEAPSMISIAGRDYLFYSGAAWTTAGYAEGVVSCAGPAGPCRRILGGPVLASTASLAGPGGGAAFRTPAGQVWLAFHAYTQPEVGYPNSRTLHLATIKIVDGVPVVTPQ